MELNQKRSGREIGAAMGQPLVGYAAAQVNNPSVASLRSDMSDLHGRLRDIHSRAEAIHERLCGPRVEMVETEQVDPAPVSIGLIRDMERSVAGSNGTVDALAGLLGTIEIALGGT